MKTVLALIGAVALVVTACGSQQETPPAGASAGASLSASAQPASEAPAAVSRPIVILAQQPEPSELDPARNWAGGGATILAHVYEGLFRPVGDTTTTIEPWLAAEIPTKENGGISADGLTYSIKLKSGATFHDGTPVDADAVVFSFTRLKSLQLGPDTISGVWIDKMEAVDPLTVQFTLTQPFGDFLASLTSAWGNYIVSPTTVQAHVVDGDQARAWLGDHDAGSGPYTMASNDHASVTVTLERFADYWGGWSDGPHIDKAIYRFGVDSAQARSLIERGDADVALPLTADDFTPLKDFADVVTYAYPSTRDRVFVWNNSVAPFTDKKVRQALQYTLDFDTIKNQIFGGLLEKLVGVIGPGYTEAYPPKTTYSFDLDKAQALLAEAGYDASNPLKFTINLTHGWPEDSAVAQLWQSDLAKIGVQMTLLETDTSTFYPAWFGCSAGTVPGVGEGFGGSWAADYASAWELLYQSYYHLAARDCTAFYSSNPQVNVLFDKVAGETDMAARQPLMEALNELLTEDAQALWVGEVYDRIAVRAGVQGYAYTNIWGSDYVPLENMYLTK